MPIATMCPACRRAISAPDAAGGKRAKCPQCGAVVDIPPSSDSLSPVSGSGDAIQELAQAVTGGAPQTPAAGAGPEAGAQPETPSPGTPSPTRTSGTTIARLEARMSPYKRVRLLGAVAFAVGVVLGALVFLAGLAGLIVLALQGQPFRGVVGFIVSLVGAALVVFGSLATSELMRLAADVGDRTRQMAAYLEQSEGRD